MPRGTASVVGYAALILKHRDPEATMAVLTADHYIENVVNFRELLRAANELAGAGYLVTLGIQPSFPSTGYGYIQQGQALGEFLGHPAYKVVRFKEKPHKSLAVSLLKRGDHVWNSGMFIWRVDRILQEFQEHMPELTEALDRIGKALDGDGKDEVIADVWPKINPQTIDYGIMEKASQVAVLPGSDLGWNDVGSWDSLFDVLPADENGNIVVNARHISLETQSSLVVSEKPERLIVTVGTRNMIVIDTENAVLICPRGDSQKVRQVVNLLKQMEKDEYL
jgi:mannose-1-phosphate guanylyltransferase